MKKILSVFGAAALFCAFSVIGQAQAEEHATETEEGAEVAPTLHFVELSPLILPIINDRGVSQTLSLIVSVEVDSEEKVAQVKKYSPRLTDAFLTDLYGSFGQVANANGGVVPILFIKERLNKLSAKVLGEGVVSDVLLQVMQRRAT